MSEIAEARRTERATQRRRLSYALILALSVLALEIVGGLIANSLALLADAGHVAGDVGAVLLALSAMWLAARPGSGQRTFGWARAEIMAAMLNGGALLVVGGIITWQAIERLGTDPDVAGTELLAFASVGLVANLLAAAALHGGQHTNLNVRGAYYHVIGDALGSVGALVAGIVILASGWTTIDTLASFVIAGLITFNAVRLLREATNVLLEAAPSGLVVEEVAQELCKVPGVIGLHDLHLWTVSSGFPALACHVEIDDPALAEEVLMRATEQLQRRFGIQHVTLQPETTAVHEAMDCCEFPDLAGLGSYSVGHRGGR
jgi:cobalt-zinc-cadmium efflux system protein